MSVICVAVQGPIKQEGAGARVDRQTSSARDQLGVVEHRSCLRDYNDIQVN